MGTAFIIPLSSVISIFTIFYFLQREVIPTPTKNLCTQCGKEIPEDFYLEHQKELEGNQLLCPVCSMQCAEYNEIPAAYASNMVPIVDLVCQYANGMISPLLSVHYLSHHQMYFVSLRSLQNKGFRTANERDHFFRKILIAFGKFLRENPSYFPDDWEAANQETLINRGLFSDFYSIYHYLWSILLALKQDRTAMIQQSDSL